MEKRNLYINIHRFIKTFGHDMQHQSRHYHPSVPGWDDYARLSVPVETACAGVSPPFPPQLGGEWDFYTDMFTC